MRVIEYGAKHCRVNFFRGWSLDSNQKLSIRIQQEQLDGRGEDEDGEF